MHCTKERLLIVDDDPAIRSSLSLLLTEIGYRVRCAQDGFSALHELRTEIPDILLSDLNMPGMSGFELLSVVRRRFPAIPVIAMSGAFSGNEVPSGVAADAFYQKGSSMCALLRIIEALPHMERRAPLPAGIATPLRIHANGHDTSGEACVTIACPECLRTFFQPLDGSRHSGRETNCIFCGCLIQHSVVEPLYRMPSRTVERSAGAADSKGGPAAFGD